MRTPETPDLPVARTNNPTHGIRGRVLQITAAASLTMLTSFHRPQETPTSADTAIPLTAAADGLSSYEGAVRQAKVTHEQMAQLDADIDACFGQLSLEVMATVGLFKFNCPNPAPKDLKGLLESMPASMRPHIIRIAKLVALHPEECERVQKRVCDKIGISLSSCGQEHMHEDDVQRERLRRIHRARQEAHEFLKECGIEDAGFKEELGKVMLAEMTLRMHTQQVAQVGK